MNRSFFLFKALPVALAMGTAWAARGQVGHEYGAAWAGGIGVAAVLAVSGRADWHRRLPTIVALGAIAWGVSGIISYGKVVGYGHTADFLNTGYGLLMLLFIGMLYGFLGGGITALALESPADKPVDWATVFTQMTAGALIVWGLLIYELEYFMTPPRSELWAACLGACLALGWYLYRNGFSQSLISASYSALGAGFGFAIGNFLQRLGNTTGLAFNWWNVMEYSIGFFGGLGMAYGILRSPWKESQKHHKTSNAIGWGFLLFIIPLIVCVEAMNTETMKGNGAGLGMANPLLFAHTWQMVAAIVSIACIWGLTLYLKPLNDIVEGKVRFFTLLYLTWYILISNMISGTWLRPEFSSQHLYWLNLLVLFFFFRQKNKPAEISLLTKPSGWRPIIRLVLTVITIVLILALLAVQWLVARPSAEGRF